MCYFKFILDVWSFNCSTLSVHRAIALYSDPIDKVKIYIKKITHVYRHFGCFLDSFHVHVLEITRLITYVPYRVGSVVSVSASHTVGRGFASRSVHTNDHHKNGTNCLPAWHAMRYGRSLILQPDCLKGRVV